MISEIDSMTPSFANTVMVAAVEPDDDDDDTASSSPRPLLLPVAPWPAVLPVLLFIVGLKVSH